MTVRIIRLARKVLEEGIQLKVLALKKPAINIETEFRQSELGKGFLGLNLDVGQIAAKLDVPREQIKNCFTSGSYVGIPLDVILIYLSLQKGKLLCAIYSFLKQRCGICVYGRQAYIGLVKPLIDAGDITVPMTAVDVNDRLGRDADIPTKQKGNYVRNWNALLDGIEHDLKKAGLKPPF